MKCTHCSKEIKKGTGIMYIYKTGDISYFCSNGCYQNAVVMERKPNPKLVKERSAKK